MKSILKLLALGIATLVVGILAYASTQPDDFRIMRSATLAAPPEKIFPLINDLRGFNRWNPFAKDPALQPIYSGPDSGKGAVHEWDGNRDVGKGRLEIVNSNPPSKVVMALDMLEPLEAHNRVEFTLEPKGSGTVVTWAMSGNQPFLGKLISVFLDCDKMVGGEFERGLSNLKALVEQSVNTASQ